MTVIFANMRDGIPTKFEKVRSIVLGVKDSEPVYWVDRKNDQVPVSTSDYRLITVTQK